MHSVATPIWNRVARHAADPGWAAVFAMNGAGQARTMERLAATFNARNIDPLVGLAYQQLAPLLQECWAIAKYLAHHPEHRNALPEICSPEEALFYAQGDYPLGSRQLNQLKQLLKEPLPLAVYRPRPVPANLQATWLREASAIAIEDRDQDVAEAVELQPGMFDCWSPAESDYECHWEYEAWNDLICANPLLMLAVEQVCQNGVLVSEAKRARRLVTAPASVRAAFQEFIDKCSPPVAQVVAFKLYWLVRAERARRTGSPRWAPRQFPRKPQRSTTGASLPQREHVKPRLPEPWSFSMAAQPQPPIHAGRVAPTLAAVGQVPKPAEWQAVPRVAIGLDLAVPSEQTGKPLLRTAVDDANAAKGKSMAAQLGALDQSALEKAALAAPSVQFTPLQVLAIRSALVVGGLAWLFWLFGPPLTTGQVEERTRDLEAKLISLQIRSVNDWMRCTEISTRTGIDSPASERCRANAVANAEALNEKASKIREKLDELNQ